MVQIHIAVISSLLQYGELGSGVRKTNELQQFGKTNKKRNVPSPTLTESSSTVERLRKSPLDAFQKYQNLKYLLNSQ